MEKSINAQYGIYYVYATNGYATMFHTFWENPSEKEGQRPTKGDGEKGEDMKKNENEEEWIEITVVCPDCIQGRVAHWKDIRTGKHPWNHLPCEAQHAIPPARWQPKFCQIEG